MNLNRLSGWLALGALLMTIGGPLSRTAYASDPQANQEVAVTASSDTQASSADDLSSKQSIDASMKSSSGPTWRGFYVGFHVGHGSGNADTFVNPLPSAATFVNLLPQTLHPNPNGPIGGVHGGYNWQLNRLVLGVETDYSWSGINGSQLVTPIIQNNGTPFPGAGFVAAHQETTWLGTLRPRVGFAIFPRLLIYGTGGLAYGHVKNTATTTFLPVGTTTYAATVSDTKMGWVAGAGGEFNFWKKLSFRAEYQRYDLGSASATASSIPPLPPFQVAYKWKETTANLFNLGLNLRF